MPPGADRALLRGALGERRVLAAPPVLADEQLGCLLAADVVAGAVPGDDQAVVDEDLVGAGGDGVAAAVLGGDLGDGWQAGAGWEFAGLDPGAEFLGDPQVQRRLRAHCPPSRDVTCLTE